MIKLIIFDFGKVLGSGADPWNEELKVMQNTTGLNRNDLERIFTVHWPQINVGKKPIMDFFRQLSRESKIPNTARRLTKVYLDSTTINYKVLAIAKNLKSKGYGLAILSNESKEKMRFQVKKFGLKKLFEKIYCSGELGLSKLDIRIFEYVLKDQKRKPEEVLFIDDRDYYIEPANSLGMNTILFKNASQLKKQLSRFLPY